MTPKIFADYSKIDLSTVEGRNKFFGAITHFCRAPEEAQKRLVELGTTQFTNTDDFASEVKALIDRFHLGLEEIDAGWQSFFDVRPFYGTPVPGFEVRNVSSGLTFAKRPEGGRARIYSVTGATQFVPFDTYGGGLEFDQAWIDDQQWWQAEDTAQEFRSKWYSDKAEVHYLLIGAIGAGYNVAYDTGGATVLEKDINTINTAAAAILTAFKALGYNVTAQTPMKILSPIQLRGRLQRALAAQYITPATAGAHLMVEYNITPVYSMNVKNAGAAATDIWYLGIPGWKNRCS